MKKLVLLLLVFALVAGQALFAQDEGVKVSGHVKTGVKIEKVDDNDATAGAWNDDAGARSEARLNFVYTNDNVGASVRLNVDPNLAAGFVATPIPVLGHAFGWFDLFQNKFEVSAGLLDNGKWGTLTDFNLDTTLDNDNLVKLELKLIDGLSFGANIFDPAGFIADVPLEDSFKTTVVGVKYAVDTFGFAAEAVFENTKDLWTKNLAIGGVALPGGAGTVGQFLAKWDFGILFSGFFKADNLGLLAELDGYFATYSDSDTKIKANAFGLGLQGTYSAGKLGAGLKLALYTGDGAYDGDGASDLEFFLTPKVSYAVSDWLTLGLEIPVGFIENYSDKGDLKLFEDWKGGFEIGVKPKATFSVGNGCTFVAFYKLVSHTGGYDDKGDKPDAVLTSTVQFDFIWSF